MEDGGGRGRSQRPRRAVLCWGTQTACYRGVTLKKYAENYCDRTGAHTVMKSKSVFLGLTLVAVTVYATAAWTQTRWSEQKANAWYAQQPWLVGSNYVPKSAINQLEMWQEATFNPAEIDQELTW